MKEYFCIFGGGGIRGAAYSGVIKALDELDIKIKGCAGSSIGAVVAGLYTFNYSIEEIQDVFYNINFQFFNDLNFKFGKDFALSREENFYEWIKNKIELKFYENTDKPKEPVKFKDIESELVIFSVDITSSTFHEFSKTKTPDVEIAYAIRASVGMPGLYSPVFSENECLVDGDLLKAMPLWTVSDTIQKRDEKILEFRLENNETKKEISNTVDYLNAVYDSMSGFASDFIIKTYGNCEKYDYVKINLEDVSVVDFMADKNRKTEMAKKGYLATLDYFKNKYPKKLNTLLETYKSLEFSSLRSIFLLKNKNFDEARYLASDMVSHVIKSNTIDEKIIDMVLEYKKLFDENYIIKKGLFKEKPTLIDYNKVFNHIEKLSCSVKNKISLNL